MRSAIELAALAAMLCAAGAVAFSCGASQPSRLAPALRGEAAAPLEGAAPAALVEGTAGRSFSTAGAGAAACVFGLVAMASNPGRRYRRVWRRKVRSQWAGRDAARKDKRPALFGPEKPPLEPKKIYHYYCNKMYKVIREASATADAPVKNEEAEKFIEPAVWNKPLFRIASLVAGGAAAGGVLPFAAVLHLFAYGTWLGTNVWTTFIAGITMFKNLERQQFGKLQAKLFPQYFQLGAVCTAVVLLTGHRMGVPVGPMVASLVATLANALYLEPKATEVMFERYDRANKGLKDPKVDKALGAKFGKLHGASSLANLVALVGLVAHGVLLAARI